MRTASLDSSALVKVYAVEPGSDQVRALLRSATLAEPTVTLVICDITLAEVSSALAREERDEAITEAEATRYLKRVMDHFIEDPKPYLIIHASSVMADAPLFARQYGLRGMDSVQLAAALAAKHLAPPDTDFRFVCADGRLCRAARAENFNVMALPGGVPAGGA